MGLTSHSTGLGAVDQGLSLERCSPNQRVIALAGNPNVGKSTVFNALTGLNQHTGNWPGKTVASAQGHCRLGEGDCLLVDLPGTYSLLAHSAEEEVARDFLCFGGADAAVVVCDATCLERNLNLVLQTLEITPRVVVCVNLMDEARHKGIQLDLPLLERLLGTPVVGCSAREEQGLPQLLSRLELLLEHPPESSLELPYPRPVLDALEPLIQALEQLDPLPPGSPSLRWIALKLLEGDPALLCRLREQLGVDPSSPALQSALEQARLSLPLSGAQLTDRLVSSIVLEAERIGGQVVCHTAADPNRFDRRLDRILTSRHTGIPIMLALLCGVFWLTISGANYPSQLLSTALFWVQDRLSQLFFLLHAPQWLHGAVVLGAYRVLAWVVSVMLPPMAIFFPLFTLLEDFGYLPRIAFNLDHCFQRCRACGKQALTMCMGFGCNAAGVVGCRIIDSPRERLIAILTNNFVPCNGRFPTLIAIITMFFLGNRTGPAASAVSALLLTGVILLGVGLTFLLSRWLSLTLLRGEPSSFTLELPPYRRPQLGRVLVRSLLDRTLFVLGRAAVVAAPAGLLLWVLANVTVGDLSLLAHLSALLDPFARLLGLDGVILLAFLLGFPANEIVVPIIIMSYLSSGVLVELSDLTQLRALLVANGWTWATAVSTMLFCLIHWPCSTTCLTIRKESGSARWTAVAILLPTVIGMAVCFIFTQAVRLLGLV